ncbi:HD domain-containing protein [bacterium]|nr:HD domain-containing protein [bacterium]
MAQAENKITDKDKLNIHREIGEYLLDILRVALETSSSEQEKKAVSDSFTAENLQKLRKLKQPESETVTGIKDSEGRFRALGTTDDLTSSVLQTRVITEDPFAIVGTAAGAAILDQEVDVEDLLKGATTPAELNESQKLLNEMAEKQRIELSNASSESSWARRTLKQEALPTQSRRAKAAAAKEEESVVVRPFLAGLGNPYANIGKPVVREALPQNRLNNPNATTQLQQSSSKLAMDQLTRSPFRENADRRKHQNNAEEPKMIFTSTFTPAPKMFNFDREDKKEATNEQQQGTMLSMPPSMPPSAMASGLEVTGDFTAAPAIKPISAPNPMNRLNRPVPPRPQQSQASATKAEETISPYAASMKPRLDLNLIFARRPCDTQVPIYSPILDNLYRPVSKRKVELYSSPLKMTARSKKNEETSPSSQGFSSFKAMGNFNKLQLAQTYYESDSDAFRPPLTVLAREINTISAQLPFSFFADSEREYEPLTPWAVFIEKNAAALKFSRPEIKLASSTSLLNGPKSTGYLIAGSTPSRAVSVNSSSKLDLPSLLQPMYSRNDTDIVNAAILLLKLSSNQSFGQTNRMVNTAIDMADELVIKDPKARNAIKYGTIFRDIGEIEILFGNEPEEKLQGLLEYLDSEDFQQDTAEKFEKFTAPQWMTLTPHSISAEEYTTLRLHAQRSEEMLKPIASMRYLCPIVRAHHERWDGKGFPDGLKGESIPLAARIIAICDAYMALTNTRTFRKANKPKEALDLIILGSGTAFDPKCVEVFAKVIKKRSVFGF